MLLASAVAWAEPVRVWPVNPHYMMFRGKPIVLVTSDHHYGAVIDRDFDFAKFLAYLGQSDMNLARIYPGGMFEPTDKFVRGNPLGPKPGRQILPWAKSDQPGAHPSLAEPDRPSLKYDLDHWDPEYFARLRAFVELAGKHGVIVEVTFFNGMYSDCWPLMALYHHNNIQGVGQYEPNLCSLFTTTDPRNADVLRRQKDYVRKIAVELNALDNVIYDLCDEPTISAGGGALATPAAVTPWLHALRDVFLEAEKGLPKKHVLGQTVQSMSPDLSAEPWCQWLPTEYVAPARAAFEKDYAANKPLVNVESDYYGHGLVKPYTVDEIRVEGWWFMVGGGAGCINLNGEYHRGQETGGPDTQKSIVPQKKILRDFMESLDLAGLRRFTDLRGIPAGVIFSAVAEPGKLYALYLFHGRDDGKWGAHFVVVPGTYEDAITVKGVPAGEYVLEWVDPSTGATKRTEAKTHGGGDLTIKTPPYAVDVALRMRRQAAQSDQPDLIFRSGFEGTTQVATREGHEEIAGVDSSLSEKSNWDKDWLPILSGGHVMVQYTGGDVSKRYARVVPEPGNPTNHVLKFWLNDHWTADSGIQKGRVQTNIYGVKQGLKEFYQSVRVYLTEDFKVLTTYPHPVGWCTISEFWNNEWWTPRHKYGLRITLGVGKPTAETSDLNFTLGAEQNPRTVRGRWEVDRVWTANNVNVKVPIGKWFTMDYYFKEGNAETGRFWMAITPDVGKRQVVFDVHNATHHTGDPAPDGVTEYNPLKLYTSKELISHVKSQGKTLQIYWDDFKLWRNKRP